MRWCFWTKMSLAHLMKLPPEEEALFMERGIRFGKALQMINILRDTKIWFWTQLHPNTSLKAIDSSPRICSMMETLQPSAHCTTDTWI